MKSKKQSTEKIKEYFPKNRSELKNENFKLYIIKDLSNHKVNEIIIV